VWIECLAGENWHEFVLWSIKVWRAGNVINSGNVGTTPVQNIGFMAPKSKTQWFLVLQLH
jgi:UDP-N-acetylmuramate dehydrogenase